MWVAINFDALRPFLSFVIPIDYLHSMFIVHSHFLDLAVFFPQIRMAPNSNSIDGSVSEQKKKNLIHVCGALVGVGCLFGVLQ